MLRQFACPWRSRNSQNCREFTLEWWTISRRVTTTFVRLIPWKSKLFHILPIRCAVRRLNAHTSASSYERLDGLTLTRYPQKLALDLLKSCGMMPRSEEHLLVGREVRGHSSSWITAGALKDSLVASFPSSLPKILGASSLLYQRKIEFPLVNLFGGTLRLNERLGCHDPFIEWAR
jgi:hypothetical protein